MTTERWLAHVKAIRDTGVEGVVIFDYPNLTDADLAALKALQGGVFTRSRLCLSRRS